VKIMYKNIMGWTLCILHLYLHLHKKFWVDYLVEAFSSFLSSQNELEENLIGSLTPLPLWCCLKPSLWILMASWMWGTLTWHAKAHNWVAKNTILVANVFSKFMDKGNTKQREKNFIGFRVLCLNEFTNYFYWGFIWKKATQNKKGV
jgi:hypothetical protein